MHSRAKAATKDEKLRMHRIKHYTGCLPSLLRGFPNVHATVQHVVEGRKRLGHRYTYGASEWHHLGTCWNGLGVKAMTHAYGPSLAHTPRQYHEMFGSEQVLVETQDFALGLFELEPWEEFAMPFHIAKRISDWHRERVAAERAVSPSGAPG